MNDLYCYFEIITLNIKQVMAVFFNKELKMEVAATLDNLWYNKLKLQNVYLILVVCL